MKKSRFNPQPVADVKFVLRNSKAVMRDISFFLEKSRPDLSTEWESDQKMIVFNVSGSFWHPNAQYGDIMVGVFSRIVELLKDKFELYNNHDFSINYHKQEERAG